MTKLQHSTNPNAYYGEAWFDEEEGLLFESELFPDKTFSLEWHNSDIEGNDSATALIYARVNLKKETAEFFSEEDDNRKRTGYKVDPWLLTPKTEDTLITRSEAATMLRTARLLDLPIGIGRYDICRHYSICDGKIVIEINHDFEENENEES